MHSLMHDHGDHVSADRFNLSYKYQKNNMLTSSRNKDDNQRNTHYTAEKRRVFKRPQSSLDHVAQVASRWPR